MRISRISILMTVVLSAGAFVSSLKAADLQTFTDVSLVDDAGNDGDSFMVRAGKRQLRVRLYYVDCAETSIATRNSAASQRSSNTTSAPSRMAPSQYVLGPAW